MKPKKKKFLLVLCIIITTLFISCAGVVIFLYNHYKLDVDKLTSSNNGIKVYSATGIDNTLYNTDRSIIEIETLPKYVKQAFIDVEDKRFYSHNGFDLKRIAKAFLVNIANQSKTQGASTISQQLIKNTLLSNEKTYSRKIKELFLAIKMEKEFDKDEILEMYLNTIYFGSNAYGIENASKIYFNKSAKDLTLNEACCLAGLIKSPSYYSPKNNLENAVERKNLVAKKMLEANDITPEEYNIVTSSSLTITNTQSFDHSYEEEAIMEACKLLNISERDLINKRYQIVTFKDDELQNAVITANNNIVDTYENSTKSSLDSISIVANNKGKVLSYYVNSPYDVHNIKRQPASTLKPLAVYLPCIEHNILSPATQILDEKINYNGFSPNNADNNFNGYVSTRYALSHSLNIPAVKALDFCGLKKSKETLTSFGININNADMNLALALGSMKYGVKLFDLVSAYTCLADLGKYKPLVFVNKILDNNGNVVYQHEDFFEQVTSAESCFLINDILKDTAKDGTAKRLSELNLPIASKTGTASTKQGNTDLYNITYSTEHTMLTWIADINDNILPAGLLSSSQPTDINKEICSYLYKDNPPKDFEKPVEIEYLPYDLIEYETNHIIVAPTQNLDRYIAYDYFKTDNKPKPIEKNYNIELSTTINNSGATISFNAIRNLKYTLFKKDNSTCNILREISNENGLITIEDNTIFNSSEIEYYLTDDNGIIISNICTIRPKDYLVTYLNNQIISNKKKWFV